MSSIDFAVRKIRGSNSEDLSHFIASFPANLLLISRKSYKKVNGKSVLEYEAYSLPGMSEKSPNWYIVKHEYNHDGEEISTDVANCDLEFNGSWDKRGKERYRHDEDLSL